VIDVERTASNTRRTAEQVLGDKGTPVEFALEYATGGWGKGTLLLEAPSLSRYLEWRKALLPVHMGFLVKQGGKRKTWKRRYFVLFHGQLAYFELGESKFYTRAEPKGVIDLAQCLETAVFKVDFVEIGRGNVFSLPLPDRTYLLQADDEAAFGEWRLAIEERLVARRLKGFYQKELDQLERDGFEFTTLKKKK